jgi:aspartyl-tRNA(Asn)/glutamyl-tRNA(Gln) amidotransferase subunit C
MRLTTEEVRHLAALARIGMTEDELELMRDQMSHILENFAVLERVDTDNVQPSGHAMGLSSVMRSDEEGASACREDILANAPNREDDFVRIRAVLE